MTDTTRDDRINREELADSRDDYEDMRPRARARVQAARDATPYDPRLSGVSEARSLCAKALDDFRLAYAAGVAMSDVAAMLDEWHDDFIMSVRVRQLRAGGAPGFLDTSEEWELLYAAADLALVATSVGRGDIARAVLEHPAVAAVPSRVFDTLAQIHGVTRSASESDHLSVVHGPWLEVGNAAPERRQAEFERLVREWRAHAEKTKGLSPVVGEFFTGEWGFETVIWAQVFGLDDGPVRDVPEYPVDMADFARGAGLPRLNDDVRLPGPWTKPAPPTVIEPEALRAPASVSGEPTHADLAALLSPVGGEPLDAADNDALLDAAIEAGTLVLVDARAIDPDDAGALLQFACRELGVAAPGRAPSRLPQDPAEALPKFDAWLAKVGVRLLGPAVDSGDLHFFPVLAADYETFAGRTIDGLRLRTMDQLAADEA